MYASQKSESRGPPVYYNFSSPEQHLILHCTSDESEYKQKQGELNKIKPYMTLRNNSCKTEPGKGNSQTSCMMVILERLV